MPQIYNESKSVSKSSKNFITFHSKGIRIHRPQHCNISDIIK